LTEVANAMRRALARTIAAAVAVAVVASACGTGGGSFAPPPWIGRHDAAPTPSPAASDREALLPGLLPEPTGAVPVPAIPDPVAGASNVGPPDWVQAGTRLTYYGAAASVAQSYYTYVEDPAGTWEDPTTGKRYRRTDESGEDMPTAAGEAYTQTDVLAVEGTDVVISTTLYSIDLLARQFTLTPMGGSRTAGTAVDGAWVNPAMLREIEASGAGDLMVLRGDYVLGDQSYRALSFVSDAPGAYHSSTYDTATGVLLATNSSTQGAGAPVHGPLDDPQGNVQLSNTRLAAVRQRSLPGMDAANPGWVATSAGLSYSGTVTTVNPLDPGSGPWVYPMSMAVRFGGGGRTWSAFTSHTVVNLGGTDQQTDAGGVTGSTGLYWYDPAALATFEPSQVLDDDPVTGARTQVESIGSGIATLTTSMNGVDVRIGYDLASGAMVSLEIRQTVTGSTIRLTLDPSTRPSQP
jgi:hypothetical protein